VIPLNVANLGNFPFLRADDVIEVPCLVDANGPRALHVSDRARALRVLITGVNLRAGDGERGAEPFTRGLTARAATQSSAARSIACPRCADALIPSMTGPSSSAPARRSTARWACCATATNVISMVGGPFLTIPSWWRP
jgi:hypothetical protein